MNIPSELRELVFDSVKLLGVAIKDIYGTEMFNQIEELRLQMKSVRRKEAPVVHSALEDVHQKLSSRNEDDLHRICKAFSLMLEIINACETAYRTHRLENFQLNASDKPDSLVYVFTSHPTEARSSQFLHLTDRMENLLIMALDKNFQEVQDQLLHLLRLSLRIPLANNKRPDVKDEAQQILHIIMDERILSEQIHLKSKGLDVFFRTWVGGDKDGHPRVGPETLIQTLTLSRQKILHFIQFRLDQYRNELKVFSLESKEMVKHLNSLSLQMKGLKKVTPQDGKRVTRLKNELKRIYELGHAQKIASPQFEEIQELIRLYPALVLPMEIREDSSLIHEALKKPLAIGKMLKLISQISKGVDPRFYVRGFIISMCMEAADLEAAIQLTVKQMGSYAIPAVPLFENEKGLRHGVEILSATFKKYPMVQIHQKFWQKRMEVMLGYSDSSKENGVLPSRMLVEEALLELEKFLHSHDLIPVFFHGSGGSTGRGGGSLKEQIAWWPQSALNIYKMTIQGETIQRHFHQPAILRSQVGKVVDEFAKHRRHKLYRPKISEVYAAYIQDSYRRLVADPEFQEMTSEATPYDFLNLLKIGSRPTKRSGKGKFTLRAIPWILCWTQTRLLLPIWWGVGTGWQSLSQTEKAELRDFYHKSPLMQSYIKNLGFTLARIEMGVWEFHLSHSKLTPEQKSSWGQNITEEYERTVKCFHELTGTDSFTWFQPRLGESIVFRSSMIHPLNVIQKIALERKDHVLLRETVTGIACGMLTTG